MLGLPGLAGNPADSKSSVAGRHSITPTHPGRLVQHADDRRVPRLPLSAELATEVTRRTHPGEDHLARTRIATNLGWQPQSRHLLCAAHRPPGHRRPTGPQPGSPRESWPPSDPCTWTRCTSRSGGPADSAPGRPSPPGSSHRTDHGRRHPRRSGAMAGTRRRHRPGPVLGARHPRRRPGTDPQRDDRRAARRRLLPHIVLGRSAPIRWSGTPDQIDTGSSARARMRHAIGAHDPGRHIPPRACPGAASWCRASSRTIPGMTTTMLDGEHSGGLGSTRTPTPGRESAGTSRVDTVPRDRKLRTASPAPQMWARPGLQPSRDDQGLEAHRGFAVLEGHGEIRLRRLVKEALRMRPSRLIVGEVRQEECARPADRPEQRTARDVFRARQFRPGGGRQAVHAAAARGRKRDRRRSSYPPWPPASIWWCRSASNRTH